MASDDQRPAWGPVEPEGDATSSAASIFAADPPGLGPVDDSAPFPSPAYQAAPEPAVAEPWAPVMATEPLAPFQPPAEVPYQPTPAYQAVPEPAVAEPWAPIMATEPPVAATEPPVAEPWPTVAPARPEVPTFASAAAQPEPGPAPLSAPDPYAPDLSVLEPYAPEPYAPEPYAPEPYAPQATAPQPFEAAPFTSEPFTSEPFAMAAAEELLPSPRGYGANPTPDYAQAPYEPAFAPSPAAEPPADRVWELGASAVEAANLQAAGAPAPLAQETPDVSAQDADAPSPSFGAEEAFVPRFDPVGGVTPAPTPSLSFTAPAPRAPDPYSSVVVPASDEPAYVPTVDLSNPDRTHVVDAEPVEPTVLPTLSDEPAPLTTRRSFLAADPAPTAPAQPTPFSPAEPWAPVPEALTAEQPVYEQPTYEQPVYEQPTEAIEAAPAPATEPLPATVHEPATAPLPWASVGATEQLPAIPPMPADHTPPTPERPASAFASPFEAVAPAASADARETLLMPLAVEKQGRGRRKGKSPAAGTDLAVVPHDKSPKKPLRIVLFAVGAVVLAAGLSYGVYRLFFWPDAVILPVPTITAAVPSPSGEPITVADASDFGASMPDTVATDVLMEYASTDPLGDASLPARAAEHLTLAYGPGTGTPTFTVEAYQHYTEEEALTAYDAYADGKADRADVEVDGTVVGERAWASQGDAGTVVWRNGTAVFVLTGPSDDVIHFFEHFGV